MASIIDVNEDGYFKFQILDLESEYKVGFKESQLPKASEISYGFKIVNNELYSFENGETELIGSVVQNDQLVLKKKQGTQTIEYVKNGMVLKSTNLKISEKNNSYVLKGSFATLGYPIEIIIWPGIYWYNVSPIIEHLRCGQSNSGSIKAIINSGLLYSVIAIEWTDENGIIMPYQINGNEYKVSGLSPGDYTLTVTLQDQLMFGSVPFTRTYNYKVGYKTFWEDKVNMETLPTPNENTIVGLNTIVGNLNLGTATANNVLASNTEGWMNYSTYRDNNPSIGYLFNRVEFHSTSISTNPLVRVSQVYLFNSKLYIVRELASSGQALEIKYIFAADDLNRPYNINVKRKLDGFFEYHIPENYNAFVASNGSFTATNSVTGDYLSSVNSADELKVKATGFDEIYTENHLVSFICNLRPTAFLLQRKLNGGYYELYSDVLSFDYTEQYHLEGTKFLTYKIYDDLHTVIADSDASGASSSQPPFTNSPTQEVKYGFNQCNLNLSALGLAHGKYTLEVTTAKNDKLYLRFNY